MRLLGASDDGQYHELVRNRVQLDEQHLRYHLQQQRLDRSREFVELDQHDEQRDDNREWQHEWWRHHRFDQLRDGREWDDGFHERQRKYER
jgi:hypothetical protein